MKRGFSLIELLVVLAIAAIFLAFIISALTQARARAIDTRNQRAIALALSEEENFFANNGFYESCLPPAGSTLYSVFAKVGLGLNCSGSSTAGYRSNSRQMVFWVQSRATPGKYFCMDSSGTSTIVTVRPACLTCPGGNTYWCVTNN